MMAESMSRPWSSVPSRKSWPSKLREPGGSLLSMIDSCARSYGFCGDKNGAKAQLSWTIDHADEEELRAIARYRLAEIQLDEKQYDEALKTLDAKRPASFNGLYADLRGDALAAAGRNADARAAYQEALATLDPKSQYRSYVQVKLDAAGGPTTPTTPAAAATPVPAAAAAAPVAAPAPATVAKP